MTHQQTKGTSLNRNYTNDPANDSQGTIQDISMLMVPKGYIVRLCSQPVLELTKPSGNRTKLLILY